MEIAFPFEILTLKRYNLGVLCLSHDRAASILETPSRPSNFSEICRGYPGTMPLSNSTAYALPEKQKKIHLCITGKTDLPESLERLGEWMGRWVNG